MSVANLEKFIRAVESVGLRCSNWEAFDGVIYKSRSQGSDSCYTNVYDPSDESDDAVSLSVRSSSHNSMPWNGYADVEIGACDSVKGKNEWFEAALDVAKKFNKPTPAVVKAVLTKKAKKQAELEKRRLENEKIVKKTPVDMLKIKAKEATASIRKEIGELIKAGLKEAAILKQKELCLIMRQYGF